MPPSKNPNRYPDCQEIFATALSRGEARIVCTTPGRATHLRQRLNTYRRLIEEIAPNSPLVSMTVRKGKPAEVILVERISLTTFGARIVGGAEPFTPAKPTATVTNPLEEVARLLGTYDE